MIDVQRCSTGVNSSNSSNSSNSPQNKLSSFISSYRKNPHFNGGNHQVTYHKPPVHTEATQNMVNLSMYQSQNGAHHQNRLQSAQNGLQNGHQNGVQNGHQNGVQNGHQSGLQNGHQNGLQNGLQNSPSRLSSQHGNQNGHQNGQHQNGQHHNTIQNSHHLNSQNSQNPAQLHPSRSSMEQEQYLNLTARVSKNMGDKMQDRDSLLSNLRSSLNSNSSYRNSITHDTLGLSKSFAGIFNNSEEDKELKEKCNYLQQLLKDKRHLTTLPDGMFFHLERILDEEIVKVRSVLFQNTERAAMALPDAEGAIIVKTHKVWVPIKDNPEYNFVGRILGPRGLTAKQLEQETQCKIMVRGKGSMRDKKKEDMNRGKQNWEHLNEELHVLITVEDSENRANVKIQRAVDEINKLLIPQQDGEDDLKKKQLMELAIINGTYRDNSSPAKNPRLVNHPISIGHNSMNSAMNTAMSLQSGVNNSPSVVSTVSGQQQLAQTVHSGYHAISPQNSVNHGYNFQTVGLNGNQVQIQRNQQLTHHQAQQQAAISQQQQQAQQQAAQQQLLGFAPVVASGPQFVRQTFVAPAQLNSPGENQVVSGNGQQHPTVYYQAAEQPTQFAYATNFMPAAAFYPAGSTIDHSYMVQQQQQAVQAQVASAQVVQAVAKVDNGESADSKDAMVN